MAIKGTGYNDATTRNQTVAAGDTLTVDGSVSIAQELSVTGNASIGGSLAVTGDIISRGAVDLVVQDNFIDLNFANSTTTAESGAEERNIMAMTGHKTTQMVRRYIKEANLFKNNALNKIKI